MDGRGRLQVLQWNLNAFTADWTDRKLDLLDRLEWDVATLQELLPRTFDDVRERFPDCEFIVRAPSDSWPRPAARRCCGILVRPTVKLVDAPEIDCGGDPRPGHTPEVPREALVAAEIEADGVAVSVVSAHPPHSAGRSDEERARRLRGKLGIYDALTAWVTGRQNVVVGMDANWWLDSSPFSPPGWDNEDPQAAVARFFFDPEHGHGLRDAFRSFLTEHLLALERIKVRRPNGPLAVTHVRGGNRPVADRFDALMVSQAARIESIEHDYEDAVAAGSDHAYVRAELSMAAQAPR